MTGPDEQQDRIPVFGNAHVVYLTRAQYEQMLSEAEAEADPADTPEK